MNIQPNIVTKASSVPSTALTGPVVGAFMSTAQPRWNFTGNLTSDGTSAYTAYAAMGTKPTTNLLYESSADSPSLVRVMPLVTTGSVTTLNLRVVGWTMYLDGSTEDWIPSILADLSFSRANATSPSIGIGGTTYYPLDNFSVAVRTGENVAPPGTGRGSACTAVVDTMGSQLVQLTTWVGSGNVAALWNVL